MGSGRGWTISRLLYRERLIFLGSKCLSPRAGEFCGFRVFSFIRVTHSAHHDLNITYLVEPMVWWALQLYSLYNLSRVLVLSRICPVTLEDEGLLYCRRGVAMGTFYLMHACSQLYIQISTSRFPFVHLLWLWKEARNLIIFIITTITIAIKCFGLLTSQQLGNLSNRYFGLGQWPSLFSWQGGFACISQIHAQSNARIPLHGLHRKQIACSG